MLIATDFDLSFTCCHIDSSSATRNLERDFGIAGRLVPLEHLLLSAGRESSAVPAEELD